VIQCIAQTDAALVENAVESTSDRPASHYNQHTHSQGIAMNQAITVRRTPGFLQGIVLLLPVTLAVMGIVVLVPVVPSMMEQFSSIPNHAYLVQGGILTMPALCAMLFSPAAGWLGDRFGRRSLLIVSMLAYALVGIAPIFLDNIWAIIATRVAVGFCEAVILTISTTMIGDYFTGVARDKWLASQTAVASLSALGLIYLGGLLGSHYGWRGPFAIYLFSLLLTLGIVLFTWEPDNTTEKATASTEHAPLPWRRLGGICLITLFASVMFYTIQTQSSIALHAIGVIDPAQIGKFTAIASLGVPIGTVVFRFVTRWPIGRLLMLEFGVIGLGFIGMGRATEPDAFVYAALFNQIGCGMVLPTLLTWAIRGLNYAVRGRGTGIWQGTFSVGQFLSGVVITFISAMTGGIFAAFTVLGVSGLVAAVSAILGDIITRRRAGTAANDAGFAAQKH
jgi:MFS family permease